MRFVFDAEKLKKAGYQLVIVPNAKGAIVDLNQERGGIPLVTPEQVDDYAKKTGMDAGLLHFRAEQLLMAIERDYIFAQL